MVDERKNVSGAEPSEEAPDALTLAESQALTNAEDLEKIEKRRAHSRREIFRDHYHRALLVIFWGFFLVVSAAGVSWAWHLLTPDACHYLTNVQLDKIQSTFFTGILSSGLTIAMKARYLG